ncbi:structural maintenance of chromosomes protein 5 [Danaus plexippus]|uniref:structural maintenance of chromosomes protein 5 n=1 Tax=Danaus plexippus TaxID=13037 RepID=UPI002AAFB472|nr:structural maintenance of chromosomes protein 5 [Danaus plexippus]
MSRIINKGSFKPGSIYRIALENFVTYKEVEFYPGKSLNLIIGPNGTGKSTFVCAIILGLCGNPRAIGRSKNLEGFVRQGCERGSIEIELYNKPGERNIIIKRTLDAKKCSSIWSLDYKTVTEKRVQEIVKSLNIQVENLCQLLPQDKVHDFSKLNPKELLHSTLTAIGDFDSIKDWDKLIKMQNDQKELTSTLKNGETKLQEEKRKNQGLKEVIDAMNQRKAIKREIKICEKKLLWAEYKELYDAVEEIKRQQVEAKRVVEENNNVIEPMKRELDAMKQRIGVLESGKRRSIEKIRDLKAKLQETISTFEIHESKLNGIDRKFQEKYDAQRNIERELTEARIEEEKLQSDKRELEEKGGNEQSLILELQKFEKERAIINATLETYRNSRGRQFYPLDNEMRSLTHKIKSLENVERGRLDKLKTKHRDTYKAWVWLKENMHEFKHPVYGPMMLNINFKEPKFARYLESTVPVRDLKAFTFESKEDMNKFNKIVREELKLRQVNAVHSEGGDFDIRPIDIRNLSYLGFYTCILDTISAPAAILRYLCSVYRVHDIPIGNNHTFDNVERVPDKIRFYFTEKHRISARVSYYKVRSTTTIEIRNADLLADSVDYEYVNALKSRLSEVQKEKTNLESQYETRLNVEGDKLKEIVGKTKEKTDSLEKIKSINLKIHFQKQKVLALEREPAINIEAEKRKCKEDKQECVHKQCAAQKEMYNILQHIHEETVNMEKNTIHLSVHRNEFVQKEAQYRRLTSEFEAAKTILENVNNDMKRARTRAKEKLEQAKSSCGDKMINADDFPYADEFNDLPSDREQLQMYRSERMAKVSLMDKGDNQVLKEYEDREREIRNLEKKLSSSTDTKKMIRDEIKTITSRWLPPLENLVSEIRENFSSMFQKLGCVGDVILYKGANDEEFSCYGLHIMVQFRVGERLRQLTRDTQSGGERALSTALYLLALQARVAVPFRCVDEINQGMDAKNERDMLQLLIKATTESDSQYFLLTPKLLLDLDYNEKTTIHTVMNGCHIMNYKKWNMSEFLQNANKINQI